RQENRLPVTIAAVSLAACVLIGLSVVTWQRSEVWNSEVDFWQDVTQKSPQSGRAFIEYGAALTAAGQTDRGYQSLLHAAKLVGRDSPDEVALARAFDLLNKDKEAEQHFKIAV